MAGPDDDEVRARNRAALDGAVAAINRGDAVAQMTHCTDDLVLEFPFSDPPKRLEGKDVIQPYLVNALSMFRLDLRVGAVHESTDPDLLIVEAAATGTFLPNDAPYENRYVIFYRFRDGLICHQREYFNPLAAQRATSAG
jgi:ketosteroid isomerase-like protein